LRLLFLRAVSIAPAVGLVRSRPLPQRAPGAARWQSRGRADRVAGATPCATKYRARARRRTIPGYKEALYSLGLLLNRRNGGDYDGEAERMFEEALRVDPECVRALVFDPWC
jgi:cytochrome c-type biogenesis protein CcmH/NrfG